MNQLLKEAHAALTAYADESPEVNDLLGRIDHALASPVQQAPGVEVMKSKLSGKYYMRPVNGYEITVGDKLYTSTPAQQEHYRALEQSLTRLQKRYGEIEASLQHELLRPGFAGVTLWLGDATVTRTVTEPEIRSERLQGAALRDAAEKCLAMYDGARGQS